MTDHSAAFAVRLCVCRQSAGLSQQELADRSGLSIRAVSNLERGRTRWPHPESVRRLADALELCGEARGEFLGAASRRLAGDVTASAVAGPQGGPVIADGGQVAPRQLPGPVRQFAGRDRELAALASLLNQVGTTPAAAVILAIGGTAGVGKTALAVHWANKVAERFPDGQLYVNLRGYDPDELLPAANALAGFLRDLGVPGPDIPAEASERAARFRSLLAGRRMLVILDNAGRVEQIRPLLPGSPSCVTLVTSRDALAGLVARDGAVRLDLDLLPLAEAIGLLRALIGARVEADPDAAIALAALCARLPLALRVAAELAAARPAASLAELAGELADEQQRLDLLDADGDPGTGVRAVFSWSYQHLDPEAACLFRFLGLQPGLDLGLYAAASLAATTVRQARRVLNALARAHLTQPTGPGRHAMHDLLRAYARELAATHDEEDEVRAALTRLFDHYLYTAAAAMDTLFPAERHRRPRIPVPVTAVPPLAAPAEARAWLDTELANLVAIAGHTVRDWPGHTIRLSATLSRYLGGGGHFPQAVVIYTHALAAARATGDHAAEATALSNLSQIDLHHGLSQRAASQLRQALALVREVGDRAGEARVLNNLATVEAQQGHYYQAGVHHQQALELYLAADDRTGAARALHGLGDMDLRLGRYQPADDHLQRALALCRESGDWVSEAYVLALLGDLSLHLCRYPQAVGHLTQALGMFREAEDRASEAWVLAHLGSAEVSQGHSQLGIDYLQQAKAVARQSKDLFGEAEALNGLGEAYSAASVPGQARTAHSRALDLAGQTGDRFEQARAHAGLARSHQAAGDSARALHHWHEALALYTELGTPEADQIRAQISAGNGGHREPFPASARGSFGP
jgi:tetratricopeptide (TPR) repeat protein/DNA-binding XRE family transcriptional regulator